LAFEDHYDSTKALSVYNALRIASAKAEPGAAFTATELRALLFEHWAPIAEEYVDTGIAFLAERQFVAVGELGVSMARPGARLKRADQNRELEWA
jgi:hypothetical protein